jgi:hypothetical protein
MPARQGKSKEKIKSDINLPEQYKYYINNNCENKESSFYVTRTQYSNFLKSLFSLMINNMIHKNDEYQLPYRLGSLCIRKYVQKVKIIDGKLVSNFPVDWNSTLKLWEEDEESKKEKKLIRHINKNKEVYRYIYIKGMANYTNKKFYKFKPTRTNKLKLKTAIENGTVDFYNLF